MVTPPIAARSASTSQPSSHDGRDRGSGVVNTSTGAASADNRYVDDDQLAALTAELDGSGLDDEITHNVQRKDPSDVLVDIAEETNAELIVIGLRRRTPVGKLILGSQAQRVLLDANCPVLAVKAPR
ncbi:universal stress protein [Phycicoccus elongatus]|uniref:universal stress protein n=1 Tax=Phycicoccus elongatus TaxID=101689 RepID=UPI003D80CBCA